MNRQLVFECHDTQDLVPTLGDLGPEPKPIVFLWFKPKRPIHDSGTPFPLQVGPLPKNLGFEVLREPVLGHVPRMIAADLAQSALMFGLLHIALHDMRLFAAFGVAYPSVGMGMVLFSLIYGPWSHLIDPLFQALSRKHEFEADAFARESVGSAGPLASALRKLSKEHLAHLTPHPLYVWLHHSHPPVGQRLAALAE